MSWFDNLLKSKAEFFTHGYIGPEGVEVKPETSYLTIDVVALWVPYVRKGLSKFYGAVHGVVDIPSESGETMKFQMFDILGDAKQMDAEHLDRIIQGPFRLLEAVPYRGGGVFLRIGLFSVKSAELALPYMNLLKKMSGVAGLAFIPQALPFVELIRDGVSIVAGGDQLEIGRSLHMDPVKTGLYVIMRATADEVPLGSLAFDEGTRELRSAGKRVEEHPYMVLRIHASPDRANFYGIPGVKEAFHRMKEQFKNTATDFEANNQAFAEFAVTVRLSADLLTEHGNVLIEDVKKRYEPFLVEGRRGTTKAADTVDPLEAELTAFNPFARAASAG